MPSEAEFMRLARLECIFGATVKNQGRAKLIPRCTDSHMHGKRRFATAAFLGKNRQSFHKEMPF